MKKKFKALPVAVFLVAIMVFTLIPSISGDYLFASENSSVVTQESTIEPGENLDNTNLDEDANPVDPDEDIDLVEPDENPNEEVIPDDEDGLDLLQSQLLSEDIGLLGLGDPHGSDLANMMSGLVIKDGNGKEIKPGADGKYDFIIGENYTFSFAFKEGTGDKGQFASTGEVPGGYLTYEIPDALIVGDEFLGITFPILGAENDPNKPIGEYFIEKDPITGACTLKAKFNKVDKYGDPTGDGSYFYDYYTDASFLLDITAEFTAKEGEQEVEFGTDFEFDVDLKYPDPVLNIKKSSPDGYDYISGLLHYEVTISNDGVAGSLPVPGDKITFTDRPKITIDGKTYPIPTSFINSISYTKYSANGTAGSKVNLSNADLEKDLSADAWFKYTFPDTLELGPGEYIKFNYDIDINALLKELFPDGVPKQYGFTAKNGVNLGDETEKPGTIIETPVSKDIVSKKASEVNLEEGYIEWEILVGDGNVILNESPIIPIIDRLGDYLTFPSSKSEFEIYFYGAPSSDSGGLNDYKGALLGSYTAADFENEFVINTAQPGENPSFTFTLPDKTVYGSDIYHVVIKYRTKVDLTVNPAPPSYSNTIDYGDLGDVGTPGGPIGIDFSKKTSGIIYDEKNDVYLLNYTIQAKVPAGYLGRNIWMRDALYLYNNADKTSTAIPKDISDLKDFKVSIVENDPGFLYSNPPVIDGEFWYLYFGGGTTQDTSKWQYNNERTVTVTYTLSFAKDDPNIQKLISGNNYSLRNVAHLGGDVDYVARTEDYWIVHKVGIENPDDEAIFDYTVTLNKGGKIQLFEEGRPALFKDTFDSSLEYVSKSFYVIDKGVSPWRYYGPYIGSAANTISSPDVMEESSMITINGDSFTVDFSELSQLVWDKTLANSSVRANYENRVWYTQKREFEVHYQLRMKDPNDPNKPNMNNKVTVETENGDFTSDVEVDYEKNPLSKEMAILASDSRIATFDIVFNEHGRRLRPQGAVTNQIKAVDTMNENLTFYLDSIKIYTQTKTGVEGNYDQWDGIWVEQQTNREKGELWSINLVNAHTAEFEIPDEMPIRIVYRAMVTLPDDVEGNLENRIEILGYSDVVTEEEYVVSGSEGSASGDRQNITVYKENANHNNIRLDGAEFDLYIAVPIETGEGNLPKYTDKYWHTDADKPTVPSGTPLRIDVGEMSFYYTCDAKITDVTGEYVFSSKWITKTHKAVFLIREKTAPKDYVLPEAPANYTFITIHSPSDTEMDNILNLLGKEVTDQDNFGVKFISDNMTIENYPVPKISVEVDKDTIKRTSAAFDGSGADVNLNGQPVNNVGSEEEYYRYNINFRSTSNIDADEFVVDDPLEAVSQGLIRVEGLWTPAVWGDKDGKMNVWYKSTKNPKTGMSPVIPFGAGGSDAVTPPNSSGHVFPTLDSNGNPKDGWKLWRAVNMNEIDPAYFNKYGVIKRVALGLPVDLADGDYITAIRFEYGAVHVGFTSKNYGSELGEGTDALPMNTAIDGSDKDSPYRNTNGSGKSSFMGIATFVNDIITPGRGLTQSNSAADIPGKGTTNAWAPVPDRSDYPADNSSQLEQLLNLNTLGTTSRTSPLRPATYLVSAPAPIMVSTDIVSSATAHIAKGSSIDGLFDQDQDKVLTREIVPFTAAIENPNIGSIVNEDSFLSDAERQGLTFKNGAWYDANGKRLFIRTGDGFLMFTWIFLAIAGLICLILLFKTLITTMRKDYRRRGVK